MCPSASGQLPIFLVERGNLKLGEYNVGNLHNKEKENEDGSSKYF